MASKMINRSRPQTKQETVTTSCYFQLIWNLDFIQLSATLTKLCHIYCDLPACVSVDGGHFEHIIEKLLLLAKTKFSEIVDYLVDHLTADSVLASRALMLLVG